MSTTTYSYVHVRPGAAPGGGSPGLSPDVLAALLPAATVPPPRVQPTADASAPQPRASATFPVATPEADVVAALVVGRRDANPTQVVADAVVPWLGDVVAEALAADLLAG